MAISDLLCKENKHNGGSLITLKTINCRNCLKCIGINISDAATSIDAHWKHFRQVSLKHYTLCIVYHLHIVVFRAIWKFSGECQYVWRPLRREVESFGKFLNYGPGQVLAAYKRCQQILTDLDVWLETRHYLCFFSHIHVIIKRRRRTYQDLSENQFIFPRTGICRLPLATRRRDSGEKTKRKESLHVKIVER